MLERKASRRRLLGFLAEVFVRIERLARPASIPDLGALQNVLILEYIVPLGNCVHMTPLFEVIKRARPETKVTVATWGIGLQVLRNSPYVDDLLATPDPLKDLIGAVSSLRRQLKARRLKPDCCLTGTADQRTKIGLVAAMVCSGWRGGLTLLPALYQRPLSHDRSVSLIENNLQLAKLLGISADAIEPRVFYSPRDAEVARKLLEPFRVSGRSVLVAVTQNSGGLPTAWHDDRWAETLRYAHRVLGYDILYVGTTADASAIADLKALAGGVGASLAGKTSINQVAALIALSDMVITLTTGTMHVTRAVGTPMVVLGLAWEKPLEWMVLDRPKIRILRGPELEHAPPDYRMDEISVQWVTAELADMTKLFPPDNAAREARLMASLSEVDHLGDRDESRIP